MIDDGDEEGIRASLLDRVGVELPPDTVETHDALMQKKYGAELIADSARRSGEGPDAYVARLLQLYPEPYQQAYILGLHSVSPAAEYGAIAVQAYEDGNTPTDPRVASMYPPELNHDAVSVGPDGKNRYALRMNPANAVEIIRACNISAAAIEGFGNRRLQETRLLLEKIARGQAPQEGTRMFSNLMVKTGPPAIAVLQKLLGEQITDLGIRQALDKITLGSLGLCTDRTANEFKDISHSVSGPLNHLDLLAKILFSLRLSLDDLNIFPEVGLDIYDAHRLDLETAPTQPES